MDIAVGVFLIIAALLNYFAAMAYNLKGKLNSEIDGFAEKVFDTVDSMDNVVSDSSARKRSKFFTEGRVNQLFSLFLYLSIPLLASAAFFSFKGSYPLVIAIAGVVAIIAEVLGGLMSKYGPSNAPGLVGGILALVLSVPLLVNIA
ncbi:hypothetical protein MNBD_GAMMA08-924 [hydrothermal vent metagenome]|uniref:Uncharacterized protein n=1 Tax=hydrothermal vent metagenome TaxID=652676 RepID=A0A3B0X5L1_9ZZZZ